MTMSRKCDKWQRLGRIWKGNWSKTDNYKMQWEIGAINLVCKLITTCLELPNANTALSVLSMVCVQVTRCNKHAVYDCAFRQLSWLRNWMFLYSIFNKMLLGCSLRLRLNEKKEMNRSWNNFNQCMLLCSVFFVQALAQSVSEQAVVI